MAGASAAGAGAVNAWVLEIAKSPDKNTAARTMLVAINLRIILSCYIADALIRTGGTTPERRIGAIA
jgi:hypothetical protein